MDSTPTRPRQVRPRAARSTPGSTATGNPSTVTSTGTGTGTATSRSTAATALPRVPARATPAPTLPDVPRVPGLGTELRDSALLLGLALVVLGFVAGIASAALLLG